VSTMQLSKVAKAIDVISDHGAVEGEAWIAGRGLASCSVAGAEIS
jgi:hypothetical protein